MKETEYILWRIKIRNQSLSCLLD